MRIEFLCINGHWLRVNNARVDDQFALVRQCYARAKKEGTVPSSPLRYRVISTPNNENDSHKGGGGGGPKTTMDQIKLKF